MSTTTPLPAPMPAEMRIANCAICTLAESMKDCRTCPFRIGLGFKGIKRAESTEG